MSDAAGGMLVVWTNVAPGGEADFDAWYTREHVADRVNVPGFRNGARYEAVRGDPRFLAVYETDTVAVLSSPTYRERLNHPTPWTQRVMPSFRDTVRATCRVIANAGEGTGGVQRTCRIDPIPGQSDALRAALTGELPGRLVGQTGVVRVRVVEAVPPAATAQTAETAMRGTDRGITFALLIDGQDIAALQAAGTVVDSTRPSLQGMFEGSPSVGDYRLTFYLGR
jgi:hypothetical protein